MAFRVRSEARNWFKDIRDKMDYDFDYYYFCLLAGFAARRKGPDVITSDSIELTQEFPKECRSRSRIIIAMFIRAELEDMGIDLKERSSLNTHIRRLVDPHSVTHLSTEGERELNKYASGGFELLTEWFEDRPRSMAAFLPLFRRNLLTAVKQDISLSKKTTEGGQC